MNSRFDFKAVAYGFGTFVGGCLLVSMLTTAALSPDTSSLDGPAWALVHLGGYLVPVAAGYVAAYSASHGRILHGAVGGALGVVLLLAPAAFAPDYPASGIPFVIAIYALLAWLGAIAGNHHRNKAGG
ncbi:hypothetical protein [Luteimonas sp. R10]|uniref:hypothetical protein n=1 Tax=Luteimonas sp. R10 TaxID=3108176 RepID=UPI00308A4C79|nr:hypothetical protein U3649_17840 [Luteimonas sp. R10]